MLEHIGKFHCTNGETHFFGFDDVPSTMTRVLRANAKRPERVVRFVLREGGEDAEGYFHFDEQSLACTTTGHARDCECEFLKKS